MRLKTNSIKVMKREMSLDIGGKFEAGGIRVNQKMVWATRMGRSRRYSCLSGNDVTDNHLSIPSLYSAYPVLSSTLIPNVW